MLRLAWRLGRGALGALAAVCPQPVRRWLQDSLSFLQATFQSWCPQWIQRWLHAFLSFLQATFQPVEHPEVSQDENQLHQARGQRFFQSMWTAKDVTIKVRIAGKTGGCEQTFLEEVSKRLSLQGVSLRVEGSTETSKDLPLLVFCPLPSRMGTDIENALQGLPARQKAVLVLMHYVQRDNTGTFVDAMQQVKCADVMLTVHTCYTLQEGFYPCEMNQEAVAAVAAALQDLA